MASDTTMMSRLFVSAMRNARFANSSSKLRQPTKSRRRSVAVPVVEAVPGGLAHRQRDEEGEQEQRRRQEQQHDGRRPADACRGRTQPGRCLEDRSWSLAPVTLVSHHSLPAHVRRGRAAEAALPGLPAGLLREFPGLLDGLGRFRRLHASGGEIGRDVIDHRADRWAEHLVVEDLVVLRLRRRSPRAGAGSGA